jgi:hypothetical protein
LSQTGTSTLGDLAVLLARPAQARTAALARLVGELRGQDLSLVCGQLARRALKRAELISGEHSGLDGSSGVDDLEPDTLVTCLDQGHGLLHGAERRAAPVDRPMAVTHAR